MSMRLKANNGLSTILNIMMRSRTVASTCDHLITSRLHSAQQVVVRMVYQSRALACLHSGHALGEKQIFGYKESVKTLNTLQSNADVLEKARLNPALTAIKNIPNVIAWLACLGITVDDLDGLNVIHVSGTKGKGSTCAFCESILRKYGLRTGFYSSPHVIAVRERIRINGQPLSENAFASYFWEVYDQLNERRTPTKDSPLPPYFAFLTLMAFHVFIKEKVDVAIVEVGIGGQYDTTNVVRKPVVCGVTSLGMDHLALLGPTLADIAWQKAGIFKPGVPAVTVQQQDEAMNVLVERAHKIGAPLTLSRPLGSYNWHDIPVVLGLDGDTQQINASLAMHLALTWIQKRCIDSLVPNDQTESQLATPYVPSYDVMCSISKGLCDCRWPGRYQVLHRKNVVYFLDGAHTPESMETCAKWFNKTSQRERINTNGSVLRVLLFNSTGYRVPESLLSPLIRCKFDLAIFCPNYVTTSLDNSSDMAHMSSSRTTSLERCQIHEGAWLKLYTNNSGSQNNGMLKFPTEITSCISDAITLVSTKLEPLLSKGSLPLNSVTGNDSSQHFNHKIHVLVSGSLHLVGGVLSILDPELENI